MYTSVEEIDKVYSEHLASLRLSGLDFDEQAIYRAWSEAIKTFRDSGK